jgi:DNA-binding GntR family transcriptional regulator
MSQDPTKVECVLPSALAYDGGRIDAALQALIGRGGPRYRTATEYVEAILREGILTGRLPAGMPLRQEDIARLFGLSRMPVREALRQLEAQALIDFAPHKGAVVTDISLEDAVDTYVIRRALETAALRLSIPALTSADIDLASDLIADMDAETDPLRLGALNRRFHMTLYARAGRPKLIQLVETQLTSFDRYLRFHISAYGRDHMAQADHRALVQAAAARDVETAVRVLEGHIDTAVDTIKQFFEARG